MKYVLPLLLLCSLQSFAQSDGDYTISGNHSRYGEFIGKGWIQNGVVQRLVRFKNFRYEDKEVEEIWTGHFNGKLDFHLAFSNLLTSFNGYSPADELFKAPVSVSFPSHVFQQAVSFRVSDDVVTEQWSYKGTISSAPLWKDLRTTSEALGKGNGLIKFISKISKLSKVFKEYRNHPEVSVYGERPEFKTATQYMVRDKTDADFYLQNPNVLRITNKTTNPLSLAEALMRRNAYGQTLHEKENFLRHETIKYNLNKVGNLENAIVDGNGNHIGKIPEYDTALWSSMFGWSEMLRYQVTNNPDALKNFRLVLDAILTLVEITNDPKEFARGISVSPVTENLGEGWVQGTGKFAHLKWRQGGNNDMIKGVFITLILAHQVVKEDETELLERIRRTTKALHQLKAISEKKANLGVAEGLDALWNRDEEKLLSFHDKAINIVTALGKIGDIGTGIYFGGIADWSGIHLTMTSNFSQLLLAKELQTVFTEGEANFKARRLQKSAENKLIDMYQLYKNTNRDFLMLMNWAYIPKFQKDPEIQSNVREALWSLKEIPAPRSFGNAQAELSKHTHWSLSAWPRLPWKALSGFRKLKDDFDYRNLKQGAYSYPYFEGLAWNCTYIWKHSPYEPHYSSDSSVKTFSADYLLVYWASRASNIISDKD